MRDTGGRGIQIINEIIIIIVKIIIYFLNTEEIQIILILGICVETMVEILSTLLGIKAIFEIFSHDAGFMGRAVHSFMS